MTKKAKYRDINDMEEKRIVSMITEKILDDFHL